MKTVRLSVKTHQFISVVLIFVVFGCVNTSKKEKTDVVVDGVKLDSHPFFKLSLAQWSLNRTFDDKGVSPFDFAKIADSLGFDTLEFVSQLYEKQIKEIGFDSVIDKLQLESQKYGLKNNLIMVDDEGDLADPNTEMRKLAVENHKKWIDAAQKLGCQAIRVNTFGTNDPEVWKVTVVDGLRALSEYAATKNINVICENHGWLSSDIPKLMEVLNTINMDNCGTLPDFGNWCVKRVKGEDWGDCLELYPDKYEGIQSMMPRAKGVSAKSYDFDENGNETTIDYVKMIQIVKDAGFNGIIGIEYEGERLSEIEGIIATRELLIKVAKDLK